MEQYGILDEAEKHLKETWKTLANGKAGQRAEGLLDSGAAAIEKSFPFVGMDPSDPAVADSMLGSVGIGGIAKPVGRAVNAAEEVVGNKKYLQNATNMGVPKSQLDNIKMSGEIMRKEAGMPRAAAEAAAEAAMSPRMMELTQEIAANERYLQEAINSGVRQSQLDNIQMSGLILKKQLANITSTTTGTLGPARGALDRAQ